MTSLDAERDASVLGTGPVVLPRVDLLPPEIGVRRRLRRLQSALAGAVAVALLAVGVLYLSAGGSLTDAGRQLAAAAAERARLQDEKATYTPVTERYAAAAAASAELTLALGQEVRFSRLLDDLSRSVPEGVWLTDTTYEQAGATGAPATTSPAGSPAVTAPGALGIVTFSGVAFSYDQVSRWLETVVTGPRLADARLTNATAALLGTTPVVNWTATAAITPAALSGRYLAPGG